MLILYGVVSEIYNESTRAGRSNWFIHCTFELLPGVPKNAKINISSVKHAPSPKRIANPKNPPPVQEVLPPVIKGQKMGEILNDLYT